MSQKESLEAENVSLGERILSQLSSGTYPCLVCTDNVPSTGKIWSCSHCYRVFDLPCIQDWAQADSKSGNGKWRCPSCNFNHGKIPKGYRCWCGRTPNPNPNLLEPHSCGYICGSQLKDRDCDHGCSLTCHPGPHNQKCTQLGPVLTCHCGKHDKQTICSMTAYKKGWSCGDVCGDTLGCGRHKCKRRCHKGLCGECKEFIKADCYCGNVKDVKIKCSDKLPFKSVTKDGSWMGNFQCDKPCDTLLSCGNHRCQLACHPQAENAHDCPLAVSAVKTCVCGKTPIEKLNTNRKSCLDPVPTCTEVCGNTLPCGHKCYWKCHDGECAPCYQSVDISCACGSHKASIACGLNQQGYQPHCELKCNVLKSCRRHNCKVKCCPERNLGISREAEIKKKIRKNEITHQQAAQIPVEAAHFCVETCGKLLSCGKHHCNAICHPGNCSPCIESQFEDLVCNCGKTILHAPYRCGTKLPPCEFECIRKTECGHPNEPHYCHPDDIPCPPCRHLTIRKCRCEKHNSIANVICSQEAKQISCMQKCGIQLPCGITDHTCQKECHLLGECQKSCTKQCDQIRSCGHQCTQPCHAKDGETTPCPKNLNCIEPVDVFCKCGERSVTVQCWVIQKLKEKQESEDQLEEERRLEAQNMESDDEVEVESIGDQIVVDESCEEPIEEQPLTDKLDNDELSPFNKESTPELIDDISTTESNETEPIEKIMPVLANSYLQCTDECHKQHRSRLMFNALQLSTRHHSSTTFDYKLVEQIYSPFVLGIMEKQPTWCLSIESVFRSITIGKVIRSWGIDYEEEKSQVKKVVVDPTLSAGAKLLLTKKNQPKSIIDSLNSLLPTHHFKPMKSIQRRFIHELAESWKLKSQAQDPEPKRSVFVKVTLDSTIPNINLENALKISLAYQIVKKEENEVAAAEAEAKRLKFEAEEQEAKLLAEQLALEKAQLPVEPKEELKYWNSILIRDTQPNVSLEEAEFSLKDIYQSSDLASIESQLALVSDDIWILMFELGPQNNYNGVKSLLATKIVKLCPLIESKVIENGWGNECFPCIIDDGVVLEIGDWSNIYIPDDESDVVEIEVEEDTDEEEHEIIDTETPVDSKWWA